MSDALNEPQSNAAVNIDEIDDEDGVFHHDEIAVGDLVCLPDDRLFTCSATYIGKVSGYILSGPCFKDRTYIEFDQRFLDENLGNSLRFPGGAPLCCVCGTHNCRERQRI